VWGGGFYLMKRWIALALWLALPTGAHAAEKNELEALLTANRWAVSVSKPGLGGEGASRITAWADEAQFFMLGEDHGSAGLAQFANALSRTLGQRGYRHTAIEIDPLMTAKLTAAMKGGKAGLARYLADDQRSLALPFFAWSEEADFIATALEFGPIWGLDQTFIGAAHIHLDEIGALSKTPAVRSIAAQLAKAARANPLGLLGTIDVAHLVTLREAMPPEEDPAARALADQLIESSLIYEPFVRGQGSKYAANLRREAMMKRYFLAAFTAATKAQGKPPKVLLKFGANHLQRGLSSTRVPALGNFLAEYAFTTLDRPVFNLSMVCGPGGQMADFQGRASACDGGFNGLFGPFGPHLLPDGATLFDLRPLRDRPELWQSWPQSLREWVWSYDALVVVKGGGPSQLLVSRGATRP
jgi:hypothetical protein